MTVSTLRRLLDVLFQMELTDEQYAAEIKKLLDNPDFSEKSSPVVLKSKVGLARVSGGLYQSREVRA